jgi:hypothetical protein
MAAGPHRGNHVEHKRTKHCQSGFLQEMASPQKYGAEYFEIHRFCLQHLEVLETLAKSWAKTCLCFVSAQLHPSFGV